MAQVCGVRYVVCPTRGRAGCVVLIACVCCANYIAAVPSAVGI